MIHDSTPWRSELWKHSQWLQKYKTQKRWPEASLVRLEESIVLCAYIARKLAEAHKLPEACLALHVPATKYPRLKSCMTYMNWHKLPEHYDLDNGEHDKIHVPKLLNLLIHSYVLILGVDEQDGFHSVIFNSDRTRSEAVWNIRAAHFVQLIERVATDDIMALQLKLIPPDPDKGRIEYEYRVVESRGSWEMGNKGKWQWDDECR